MATYYFEGHQIVVPFSIESKDVTLSSESFSLKQMRRSTEAQRWDISFNVYPSKEQNDLFVSMLTNARDAQTMVMPQLKYVDDTITVSNYLVAAANGAIAATSLTASCTDTGKTLPAGSFIQFSNHSKLYVVTSTVTTSASFQLNIFPSLRVSVPVGTTICHPNSAVKPTLNYYRSIDSTSGITFNDGILADVGTINLKEIV